MYFQTAQERLAERARESAPNLTSNPTPATESTSTMPITKPITDSEEPASTPTADLVPTSSGSGLASTPRTSSSSMTSQEPPRASFEATSASFSASSPTNQTSGHASSTSNLLLSVSTANTTTSTAPQASITGSTSSHPPPKGPTTNIPGAYPGIADSNSPDSNILQRISNLEAVSAYFICLY